METINEIINKNNYVVDYLSCGSPIFQSKNLYTFTSDSIALANFVKEESIGIMVDLCSGSGIVGLEVLSKKRLNKLYLVEVQKPLYDMAVHTVSFNKQKDKITLLNIDCLEASNYIPNASVDVVTLNPPYFKMGAGKLSKDESRRIARTESSMTLEGFIKTSYNLLKKGGKLYMVHIYDRLNEIKNILSLVGFNVECEEELSGRLKRVLISAKKY